MQEAGGPSERLVGAEPRRSGEDVSDDDVDVARLDASRQRRAHDLLEELRRQRRHLLPPRSQVGRCSSHSRLATTVRVRSDPKFNPLMHKVAKMAT